MEKLAERAARLFSPEPWEHSQDGSICIKCGAKYEDRNDYQESGNPYYCLKRGEPIDCPVPDPIDITKLGPALEAFRGLISPSPYGNEKLFSCIRKVLPSRFLGKKIETAIQQKMALIWILSEATPKQIWEINCGNYVAQ